MGYINTIADLEAQSYGLNYAGHAGNDLLKAAGALTGLHTSHDGSQTAPTGFKAALYNQVYGQKVWSMLNRECNALSIISKRPYTSSGWRILKERPAGGSNAKLSVGTTGTIGAATTKADLIGGVAENQSLGTGGLQAIAPTYTQLYLSPKTIAHQFEFSEIAIEMAKIDDGTKLYINSLWGSTKTSAVNGSPSPSNVLGTNTSETGIMNRLNTFAVIEFTVD